MRGRRAKPVGVAESTALALAVLGAPGCEVDVKLGVFPPPAGMEPTGELAVGAPFPPPGSPAPRGPPAQR